MGSMSSSALKSVSPSLYEASPSPYEMSPSLYGESPQGSMRCLQAFMRWDVRDLQKERRPRSCCTQGTGPRIRFPRLAKIPPREKSSNRPGMVKAGEPEVRTNGEANWQRIEAAIEDATMTNRRPDTSKRPAAYADNA